MKWHVPALAVATVLAGCSSSYPKQDFSTQERISQEMARVSAESRNVGKGTAPVAVSSAVLGALVQSPDGGMPSPATRTVRGVSAQRFDLVVNDAPIGQVLSGLVEGTDYSVMLKPASEASTVAAGAGAPGAASAAVRTDAVDVSGKRVSFKLKNITLFEALDAIRDVYGYDYTVEGRRILVQPAELQTRLFYVNYILGQRRGVSDIQVIGGASVGQSSSSSVGASSSSTSSYGSVQATGLSTAVKSDVWGEAEDALRTLLGCNIPRTTAVNPALVRPPTVSGQNNASRADVSNPADPPMGERQRGVDGCTQGRALAINAMSGTILVRGMPTELRLVERMLRNMQISISRQVIIESKIIDVELNKEAQQGINWSLFNQGMHRLSMGAVPSSIGVNQPGVVGQPGGTLVNGANTTLSGLLGTTAAAGVPVGGVGGIAFQATNFASLINFMESQGRVHVLSSPRISTLNNQKAVIKVGKEEPFVTNITGGTSSVSGTLQTVVTNPSLTYQPFFSGIALDVTPQIDSEDNITLHVHSMVNQIIEKDKIAGPGFGGTTVPFAVNSMNETDSVVKARDGQVVVIGGLMSERNADVRGGVPGARDVPVAGALFNWGSQESRKRELVILIKPIVVKDESTWTNMIADTEERIGGMKTAPR